MELKPGVLEAGPPKSQTRGSLKAARILEVDEAGNPKNNPNTVVNCMFNPYEYTVSKSNTFKEQEGGKGNNSPIAELSKAGAQTLKLNLVFDTYEQEQKDVSLETSRLWQFMKVKDAETKKPKDKKYAPLVAFQWGVFYFVSYITNMTQKFTLFTKDGVPVRATVEVTFTQYFEVDDYPRQNPTSGGGSLNRVWRVVTGDRLDLIAAQVYKDATKWRTIASYNQIVDPLQLRPGQTLLIPLE